MGSNRQMEVHYIDTGFPYTVTESFMDLFEGLTYAQADAALAGALQDQGNNYWPLMHTSTYKYGFSGPASNSYYSFSQTYEVNDHSTMTDSRRRTWDGLDPINIEDLLTPTPHGDDNEDRGASANSEECPRNHHNGGSSQVLWQDNVDPDSMTYEELLDLGETVGSQSRGLTRELISCLPTSKYKCSFFSRKSKAERCVICQMEYKRGDRQMTLPCKHVYHAGCVSRWLGINKACPVCFVEVFGDKTRR